MRLFGLALAACLSMASLAIGQDVANIPDAPNVPDVPSSPVDTAGAEVPPPGDEPPMAAAGDEAPPIPPVDQTPAPPALRVIIVDAAPYGIDPVVGRHVTDQMRATAGAMGYDVVTPEDTITAAQQLRMPYPPTPADLWRVTYAAQSQRGAFARVWAHAGSYVVEVSVASLDNSGPYFARGSAGASDLHAVVDRLFRQAMPAPGTWNTGGGNVGAGAMTFAPAVTPVVETPEMRAAREQREREQRERAAEDRRQTEIALRHRWHLVLQTEGAIGTSQDGFYNHIVGGRIDYRVSRDILFGAYVGYANLRGKDGRADNILMYLMIEDRVRISSASDITIPLRVALGYLPFNGPVIRLSAGINIPLSERFQLGFDILTPTFWVLPERTAVSLDIGAELIVRL